jgi:hypothetical protein
VHFLDAHGLAGEYRAEIDFLLAQTDAAAAGDHEVRTTEAPHVESDSLDLSPDINFIDSLPDEDVDLELIEIEDVSLTAACDAAAAEQTSLLQTQLQPQQNAIGDYIAGAWQIEIPKEGANVLFDAALRELGSDA